MKKNIFRFLCVLLAAVMLTGLMPTVLATEGDLELGAYEIRFYDYEPRIWTFTPSETGEYLLFTPPHGSLLGQIVGQTPTNSYTLQTGQAVQVYSLTAGTAYQVSIQLSSAYDSPYSDVFRLDKKQPLQSLTLSCTELTGQRDSGNSIYAELYPAYYLPDGLSWTTSDSSVVSIESTEGYECYFRMNKVGTAVLTAKMGTLSASCTVTVEKATGYWDDLPVWPAGQTEMECTVSAAQGCSYAYTPNQTGTYALHGEDRMGVTIYGTSPSHVLNERTASTSEGDYYLVDLIAGETYVIGVGVSGDAWTTGTVSIQKAQEAQSITLYGPNMTDGSAISGYVGGLVDRYAVTTPSYAYALTGRYRYISSDTDIAYVEQEYGDGSNHIFLTEAGSCTVTVTAGSVSVVCPVTVKPSPVLEVGKTTTLSFEYQDAYGVTCLFTPSESGNYTFTVKGSGGTCYIEDTQIGNFIYGSGSMGGWLQGGKTYEVILGVGNSDHTVTVYGAGSQPSQDVTDPSQGEDPVEPSQPADPDDPTEPTVPADPSEPTVPDSPSEPTAPDVPVSKPEMEELADLLGGTYDGSAVHVKSQNGELTVPSDQLAQLAQAQTGLVVQGEDFRVELDSAALGAVARQAEGDVKLHVRTGQHDGFSDQQKAALKDKRVAGSVSVTLTCNGTQIHEFEGGQASVTVPLTPDGEYGQYAVYYLSPEGDLEKMDELSWEDGSMTFRTGHFSDYVILQEAQTAEPEQPDLLIPILIAVAAVAAMAAAVTVILLRKKK